MNSVIMDSIQKSYGTVKAVSGVSLAIEEGSMFALLGPDGAGKTTLFRIITSIIEPCSGKAGIFGFDTIRDASEVRKIIGYMPQKFSLYPDLTVRENLDFYSDLFMVPKTIQREKMKSLLGFSRLDRFTEFRAGALSGGMKQKLALCCALIHTPRLLILDEPTTGVDPVSRREFWAILSSLKKEGVTVLYSTPYMDEASLADRMALMHGGRILAEGTEEEIIKNFRGYIYSVRADHIQSLVRVFKTRFGTENVQIYGDRLHISLEDGNAKDLILQEAVDNHFDIKSIEIVPAGIEDAFVGLLKG